MASKRRRIQLDRGDTLGGTVPLLLRDQVIANAKGRGSRFLHKDRRQEGHGIGWILGLIGLLLVLALAGLGVLLYRDGGTDIPILTTALNRLRDLFTEPMP